MLPRVAKRPAVVAEVALVRAQLAALEPRCASTASSRAGARSRAGRCTATCSRRSARAGSRSASTRCSSRTSGSPRPAPARIRIGAGTFLNIGVMVASVELVEIGDHCMFANGCFVTDGAHRFDDPDRPVPWQGFTTKGPTRVGDNVWCGANVVVTSGVTIGERCVIGANSVVTRDIPAFSIAAGAPRGCCGRSSTRDSGQHMTIRWNGRSSSFAVGPFWVRTATPLTFEPSELDGDLRCSAGGAEALGSPTVAK